MGKRLSFRWCELRFILGPWRWMVVVYAYDVIEDTVWIVTIEDGRSPESALGSAGRP